jgi:NADH-quinone oxidoreductase subunit K
MSAISSFQLHLGLSFFVFCLGAFGFLTRRSGIVVLMCLELMLNGVNLALVTFSNYHRNAEGSSLFLFIVLVAAAEAAVALSIFVALFRRTGSDVLEDFKSLRG